MKKKLLVLLLLCGGIKLPAQTIVQQFFALASPAKVSDMDLQSPTGEGSTLIAMPGPLTPGVKVLSVTDNAPAGGNTYKQVPGAAASSTAANASVEIWYCENCNAGVTELKFHLSDRSRSINAFLEVSNLALSSVQDGSGAHISDGTGTNAGSEVGPSIATTSADFIIARYFSTAPIPTGVTPAAWIYNTNYAYVLKGPAGAYQPTLTGGAAAGSFCMSVVAFKIAPSVAGSQPALHLGSARRFPYRSTFFANNDPQE